MSMYKNITLIQSCLIITSAAMVFGFFLSIQKTKVLHDIENVILEQKYEYQSRNTQRDFKIEYDKGGNISTDDWVIFHDQKIGLKFKYPQGTEVRTYDNLDQDFDNEIFISVVLNTKNNFSRYITFSFRPSNYQLGAGEGCCQSYAGPPINLRANIEKQIINQYEEVYDAPYLGSLEDIKLIEVGGKKSVQMTTIGIYTHCNAQSEIIIPFFNSFITNGTISFHAEPEYTFGNCTKRDGRYYMKKNYRYKDFSSNTNEDLLESSYVMWLKKLEDELPIAKAILQTVQFE